MQEDDNDGICEVDEGDDGACEMQVVCLSGIEKKFSSFFEILTISFFSFSSECFSFNKPFKESCVDNDSIVDTGNECNEKNDESDVDEGNGSCRGCDNKDDCEGVPILFPPLSPT
jgi:hypothetical protein